MSLARSTAWITKLIAIVAVMTTAAYSQAQSASPPYGVMSPYAGVPYGPPMMPPGMSHPGAMPQGAMAMPPRSMRIPHGPGAFAPPGAMPPVVSPAMYAQGGAPGYPVSQASCAQGGCTSCGDGACGNCGGACGPGLLGGRGLFGNRGCGPNGCGPGGLAGGLLGAILPNGEGGNCAPRWFDIHAEFMFLDRDINVNRRTFSSDNIGGNIVLDSYDLSFNEDPGFRITGAYQTGPGSNFEISYFGGFHHSDSASATSGTNSLYSVFSDFGTFPAGGFDTTDQAHTHTIAYAGQLNSLELDYRRRIVGPNCRVHSSWLVGFRYLRLSEDFRFLAEVDRPDLMGAPGARIIEQTDHTIATINNLWGGQVGGDFWYSVIPGFKIGSEFKAGVYGNDSDYNGNFEITSNGLFPPAATANERDEDTEVSFVGEANIMAIWRINHNFTLRFGYHLLYVDQVALALDNFNDDPPDVFLAAIPAPGATPLRQVDIDTNGTAFYQGMTAGLEWMW